MSEQKAVVVPDYLKAMTGAQASSGAVDSLASAAMSIPRISMRAKKFRFMEGGQEVLAVNDKISVVIYGVEPGANLFIKAYYAQAYGGANQNNPPDCASDDGVRPSGWISNPVSPVCASCPKNRFGSATSRSGKPAKACRDSKRLWVARVEDAKNLDAKPTLYALGVPVTSLKNLAEFGREIKQLNVPMSAVICEVSMDDDTEYPLISFQYTGFLAEAEAKAAIALADKAEWKLGQISTPAIAQQQHQALPGQPAASAAPAPAAPAAAATPAPTPQATAKNMDDIVKNW